MHVNYCEYENIYGKTTSKLNYRFWNDVELITGIQLKCLK